MRRAAVVLGLLMAAVPLGACGQSAGVNRVAAGDEPSASTTTASTTPSTTTDGSSTSTSTTTSSTTTTTSLVTTPETTETAAPTTWRFEGRHAGVGHFALHTGRCPFLDHEQDETFTLSDGTTWSFRSEFCGTIDDTGMWSGAGTFSLTAGDGSQLSGTTANSAQLPTVGEPYTLDVHSGTGQFEGATGTCDLENHLRQPEFGVQEQWGAFVCNLSR